MTGNLELASQQIEYFIAEYHFYAKEDNHY